MNDSIESITDANQVNAVDLRELRDSAIWTLNAAKDVLLQQGEVVLPGNSRLGGIVIGSLVVGAGLGAVGSYFFTRRRLETKSEQFIQEELEKMRKHYRAKAVALENNVEKPKLDDLVREQGYATEPPMAVTPPAAVVDAAKDTVIENKDQLAEEPPETPETDEAAEVRNIFERAEPQENDGWDHHTERARRSPVKPYVIHQDERDEYPDYDTITYTYYETDDVLCNERDEVIGKPERDVLVGEGNLNRFGHGSGDPSIVYVRNDRLELVMEVIRSPNSYAEEVHGFQHSDTSYHRPRRGRRSSQDDE